MYEAYYGLKVKPFQLNPDPQFYFDSKQHRRASAYLEYGLHQNEGFIVITGEIGAGKTTIVRGLLETLDQSKVVAAQLVSTQLDADDMLRMVAAAFGVRFKDMPKADILLHLEGFLVDVARRGKRCLLVVDEAQNLTPRAVEELRMLSNFQFESHALLQSFLVGQPEFRAMMLSPQMEQLRQRVIAACHIGPLDPGESKDYVLHRLKCAGWSGDPIFADDTYEPIYKASGGIPRRINAICDRLLLAGFLADRKQITKDDCAEIAAEVDGRWSDPGGGAPNQDGLRSPSAVAEGFADAELDTIEFDDVAVGDADRLLGSAKNRRELDRLVRLERSLLRLEHTTSLVLRILQRLIDSARVSSKAGGQSSRGRKE